jgi:ribosome assembly protein 1
VCIDRVNAHLYFQDAETLERGLLKLSLADSSVEVSSTAKGERILACLGEIHLEQSILDLKKVYCEDIELRISDPITPFCETTDWFENEGDIDSFLEDKSPPLRQSTIPPYCDEEGLAYASRGRCRTILSGRGAAISIRAVPLPRTVCTCLQSKQLVKGSEDDLITVGKALAGSSDGKSPTAHMVLELLLDLLIDIDDNGNALLESPALSTGNAVKAVQSTNGEVYVPQKEGASKVETPNASAGYEEYQAMQLCLRGGRDYICSPSENAASTAEADATALKKWRLDLRGSSLAGFQLAMRAGPLCEEPVRGVAVILECVEIAVTASNHNRHSVATGVTGGMVVAALRSGIRCALL